VWQTDDSPRYAGLGEWTNEGGVPRWRSNWTWRPLARRDAVRHPVYDRYMGINRHSLTSTGWIHWQDNMKMGMRDGKLVPFVQEMTLNTYTKFDGFNAAAADAYWAKTKDYWAAVRGAWDVVIVRDGGINVIEQAESGSASGVRLMGFADDVNAGKLTTAAAITMAKAVIAEVTSK
jgi:nucleoside-specific outer membrane channel protein Tsx